jgi:O-methyltransferase
MNPLAYAEQIAYSSKEVLRFTYDMSVKYRDSPGVYCECGVAAGAQIIAMAAGAPNKTIYAFDSFEGIPLPSNKDDQMPGIRKLTQAEQMALPDPGKQELVSSGATAVPVKDVLKHFKMAGVKAHIVLVQGWFEETLPELLSQKDLQISILRLDGDLYNSTYVCLKHLYPKVIKGGLVIVDDWKLPGCQEAVQDYFWDQELKMATFQTVEFNKDSIVIYWTK